jgi:hypothetical protein
MTTLETLGALHTPANVGEWVELGDHRGRVLVSSESSAGAFLLVETEADPTAVCRLTFTAAKTKRFTFWMASLLSTLTTNQFLRNLAIRFSRRAMCRIRGAVPAKPVDALLLLVTPGDNFQQFAMQMAMQQIVPSGPDSIARLCALADAHGITMLPPTR